MMNILLRIIMLFALIFSGIADIKAQIAYNIPKRELRAVWLTTLNGLDWPSAPAANEAGIRRQKLELTNILDRLQAANFNAIVMQARIRGTVIYPSQIEPWDPCLTGRANGNPGYDPLRFAIEECHKRGMQLHAWVVSIPGNKLAQLKNMGNTAINKRVPKLVLKTSDNYMLDPGVPGTADYLADICEEITRNYDIDGISLDYIRYPEKEIKFSDAASYRKYSITGQSLADWRRNNINRIVQTIHSRVKAIKPWVALSCSPVGKYADTRRYSAGGWNALNTVSQDAKLWLSEGWMDILMPMMYFRGNNFYPFALDWQEDSQGRTIACGLGIYLIDRNQKDWPRSTIESEINYCRQHGLGGQVFFRSQFITNNTKGIYEQLKNNLYRTKALPPQLHMADTSVPFDSTDVTYVLYRSSTYPVDTDDPNNIYMVGLHEPTPPLNPLIPQAWQPYYAVSAIDRYGRESLPRQLGTPFVPKDISAVIP